jgi:acetyl-CoA carboxylase biotin carboxyl carrier protein
VEIKDIKAIIDLMKKNSITEFELEEKDSKLRLKRGLSGSPAVVQSEETISMMPLAMPLAAPNAEASVQVASLAAASVGEIDIKSPMIGTFYRSPSPESAAYVDVGSEVNIDTVVCLIEAMKVMNEIKSEVKGVVTQVLMENGKPVEFGQPMFKVRPL